MASKHRLVVESSFRSDRSVKFKEKEDNNIKITHKNLSKKTLSVLRSWRNDETLCDVKINVNGLMIPAHKVILAASSEYFRAMFTVGMEESGAKVIDIPDVDHETMKLLVDYMYTGNLIVSPSNAQDVLILSDMFLMEDIKESCIAYMLNRMDVSNCLGLLELGEKCHCTRLKQHAMQFIKKQFQLFSKVADFLQLSVERFGEILEEDDLYLGPAGEEVILTAVTTWLQYDLQSRIGDLKEILPKVRLNFINQSRIEEFRKLNGIAENTGIQSQLDTLLKAPLFTKSRRELKSVYAIGGYLQSRTGPTCPKLKTVERLDSVEWLPSIDLPKILTRMYAVCLQGRLLCFGSFENRNVFTLNRNSAELRAASDGDIQVFFTSCYEFNSINECWTDVTKNVSHNALVDIAISLYENPQSLTSCSVNNHIYAVHAVKESNVSCLEVAWDSPENQLSITLKENFYIQDPEMSRLYINKNACTEYHNGHLYLIGGEDPDGPAQTTQYTITNDVRVMKIGISEWSACASMNHNRISHNTVVLGGMIYAIGGFNGIRRIDTVEYYNPEQDTWTLVRSMNKPRTHMAAVALEGKIYVLGGKSYSFNCGGARKVLRSCEVYDPEKDEWKYTHDMRQARCMFAAVAM